MLTLWVILGKDGRYPTLDWVLGSLALVNPSPTFASSASETSHIKVTRL